MGDVFVAEELYLVFSDAVSSNWDQSHLRRKRFCYFIALFFSSVETKQYSQQFPNKYIISNFCSVLVSVLGLLNAFPLSEFSLFAESNIGVLPWGCAWFYMHQYVSMTISIKYAFKTCFRLGDIFHCWQ